MKAGLIGSLITSLGVDSAGPPGSSFPQRQLTQKTQDLSDMLDDLFAVSTPGEVGKLLNGNPTSDTMKMVGCLVDAKYGSLSQSLKDPLQVENMFGNLGNMLDKTKILTQLSIKEDAQKQALGDLCESPVDDIKRDLLSNKGLTPQEIEEQIQKAKDRKIDRMSSLMDLINKDNMLDGVMPPMFCTKNSDGTTTKGMIPRNPPSFQFMMDKTINTVYEGVHITFNQEVVNFPNLMTEPPTSKEVRRTIERTKEITFIDSDGDEQTEEVTNPEYMRLVSQGVPVEDPFDPDGDPVVVTEEDITAATPGNSIVARGLRDNLKNLGADTNIFKVVDGGIDLIIPNVLDPLSRFSTEATNVRAQE